MSKTYLFKFLFYALIIFAAPLLSSCSSVVEVVSDRQESPIIINGDRSDWTGNLAQSDDRKIAFGFRNDSQFLYLLVTTPDRATAMKMLLQGLTISISSGDGEKLDIKYPIKPLPEDLRDIRGMERKDEQPDLESFVQALKKVNDQIQVVTKEDYPIYTAAAAIGGKHPGGSFGMSSGQFVIELLVPLSGDEIANRLFPVYPNELFVNFKTGQISFDGPRPEGGGKGQGGGGGMGRGGGRGGRGGDRPGGGARPDFKPVDQSFRVKIAK